MLIPAFFYWPLIGQSFEDLYFDYRPMKGREIFNNSSYTINYTEENS